ncbi:MAG: hypothetical protein LC808_03265 [Actinobacteria bacterium]|nr:hypothetical protein [Actinomycetota bacterium]
MRMSACDEEEFLQPYRLLPPPTEPQDEGVRRVTRKAHEYNYSAARRDYLVRRYALRWVILPFALISVALASAYVMDA